MEPFFVQNTEKTLFKKLMDFTYVFLMVIADCSGVSGSPGVYSIQVDPDNSVQAACLEGGWTVIQSRGFFGNPPDYFAKGWAEYKAGFGMPGR